MMTAPEGAYIVHVSVVVTPPYDNVKDLLSAAISMCLQCAVHGTDCMTYDPPPSTDTVSATHPHDKIQRQQAPPTELFFASLLFPVYSPIVNAVDPLSSSSATSPLRASLPRNVTVIAEPSGDLLLDSAVGQAKEVYGELCPGEDMFPVLSNADGDDYHLVEEDT